tara:strand:- start:3943 stop:4974 length:1032 start_codon:yes stop_codon:yes gene_type:complete
MRNLRTNRGVTFDNLNDTSDRGRVVSYHSKPHPVKRTKATKLELNGIKREDRRNILIDGEEVESKFTIGFEIEKTQLHRGCVQEYPLFCGFETDSSCGYEAVTHVLPLLPKSVWRTKVFNMFHEATKVIDDNYSPSNSRCGGHITIGVEGMDGSELMSRIRKFVPILYAIFRKRLHNGYCYGNPQLVDVDEERGLNSNVGKYSVALNKGFGVEFRLPARVTSVKQMIRRYELFYHIVDFAVNRPNATYNSFIKAIKPILLSMYNQDEEKVVQLIDLSTHFRKFIFGGRVTYTIVGWLEGWWSDRSRDSLVRSNYNRQLKQMIAQDGYSECMRVWRSTNQELIS